MIVIAAGTITVVTVYFLLRHGPRWAGLYLVLATLQQVLFLVTRRYLWAGIALGFTATYLLLRSYRDRPPKARDSRDRGRPS